MSNIEYLDINGLRAFKQEEDKLLSQKEDNINDLDAIRSGAALGATSVQPADIANDMEVVAYQTQTPLSVEQLAKAEAGKLAIYKDNLVYTKFYQDGNIVSFQALEHMSENGAYTPAYNVRMRRYTLTLDRSTRMLNDAGYQQGVSVADTAANFLAASEEPAADGKKIIREMNLAEAINEFVPIPDEEITDILENARPYIIGFTGMSQSNPRLTRTDSAVGATWAVSNGVIEVTGIDMSKIWGGYVGNDGEELTWDGANFLKDGVAYTGNVFSKINRFFCKPVYVDSVLDGYQLIFANSQPEGTEDWFYGKDYVGIGCYKARGPYTMTSVRGVSRASVTAAQLVAAYKLASTTSGSLHEKWFNENAILQVLFMAIFATRQTEDVFPQGAYRHSNDSKTTGFMDSMRTSSTIATGYTTSYSSATNGNMFLGIEDFIGFGYELVAGVKLSGTSLQVTRDFANFSYSGTFDTADVNLASFTSGEHIKSLQQSESIAGLLIPKEGTGDTSTATTYFCDRCWTGQNCWFQGAVQPQSQNGVFYTDYAEPVNNSYVNYAGRLCRTPA